MNTTKKTGTFTILTAKLVKPVLSKMSHANTCVKSWWKRIVPNTVIFRAGKRVRLAIVIEFVNEKPQSKNKMNNKLTSAERRHLAAVKELPCGVCGAAGPSDAHHIIQHQQYLCIPLCKDCHQGSFNGIHGQQRIWKVLKKTEMSVLNDTIKALLK